MSGKMLVVFVKGTGHVLSAATVAAAPLAPPVADLVGDALTLWSIPGVVPPSPSWSFAVPADALDVAVIDQKPELLEHPFDWRIGTDKQAAQLQRISQPGPTVTKTAGPPPTITLDVTPGFKGDGVGALVLEQSGTAPVQVLPSSTTAGVVTVTYTGNTPTTVLGFIAEFPLAVHFF